MTIANLTRRTLLATGLGGFTGAAGWSASAFSAPPAYKIFATGLQAPESPKPQHDGSVVLVEMARGTLSRVNPAGRISVIAELGGNPSGVAIGPDGAAYVCNSGSPIFRPAGNLMVPAPFKPSEGGSIQRVNLSTGAFTTLYEAVDGAPLQGPDDLVFDRRGGFWFTASSTQHPNSNDRGAAYWATTDAKTIRRVAWVTGANGIALSPDGGTLYVVQSGVSRVLAFSVAGPGQLVTGSDGEASGKVLWDAGGKFGLDSMAVDSAGNAVVGAIQHGDIVSLPREGALVVIAPDGTLVDMIALPDRFVTNVGFGGPGLRTAYASLTTTGQLAAIDWPRPGLALAYP